MIPQDKSAAVTLGLNETFGVTEFEDIRDLTERPGSNRAFRIIVRGSAYLLRINTRPGDMTRHFTCMQAAADAGLAPRVRYACTEDRIYITDFVEAVPLPAPDALVRIPAALRTLHALPPFPGAPFNTTCTFLLNKGPAQDGFLQNFRASSILPENEPRNFSLATSKWPRFTRVSIRIWRRVITTCSSRTICSSTATVCGWWTGRLLSRTIGMPTWRWLRT